MSQASYRLSVQQRRLWTAHGASSAFHGRLLLGLEGEVSATTVRAAVTRLVESHEILRTRFARRPGLKVPFQVVDDEPVFSWSEHDLSALEAGERNARLDALVAGDETGETFELEDGPFLRVAFLTLAAERHALFLELPSLCADAQALVNLAASLARVLADGEDDDEEPVQVSDYAEWLAELLDTEDEDFAGATRFWEGILRDGNVQLPHAFQENLAESVQLLHASQENVTKSVQPLHVSQENLAGNVQPLHAFSGAGGEAAAFAPQSVPIELPDALTKRVKQAAAQCEVSLEIFLLAAWQVLLGRLGGGARPTVGKLYDGRQDEELWELIGPLARVLPITVSLQGRPRFADVARKLRAADEQLAEWQDYAVWDEGRLPPLPAEALPHGFELHAFARRHAAGGATVTIERLLSSVEPFLVATSWLLTDGELTGELRYDAARLERAAAAGLARRLVILLDSAARCPEATIHALEALADDEKRQLIALGGERHELAPAASVFELFARQAAAHPERSAVRYEDEELSFAELRAKAHSLAARLQSLGVGPEDRAGILMERSTDWLVALLAVLEAGAAYVPLDPALPAKRLALLTAEAGCQVILSHRDLDAACSLDGDVPCLDVATVSDEGAAAFAPSGGDPRRVDPRNLAYVLFTSGSTGRPKGVAVEHRQLWHYVHAFLARAEPPAGASYAVASTFAADLGNTMIYSALATGGCLHVVSSERASDPDAFARYSARHQLDALKIVPSHLTALLSAAEPQNVLPRRLLVLGGEALPPRLLGHVCELALHCRVLNHYGPTEATVGVTTWELTGDVPEGARVPLGRPLPNARVHVLSADLRLLPSGVAGELCLGGDGLARGYLGAAAQTAARFVPDPLSDSPGERLYRSGDLGRRRRDGLLEFLGRVDHQVKIRGFRIELGEIEAVLRAHPDVREALVIARPEARGEKVLVAYVVAVKGRRVERAELRDHVRASLPDAMVPSAVAVLDALPLNANGKVDLRALPDPEQAAPSRRAFVAPRGPVEESLAAIWARVLGVDEIGAHDNFFDLGGDSILAIQVVAAARRAGLVLRPKEVFAHQTVAELAMVVGTGQRVDAEQGPVVGDVPLTPIQRWFFGEDFTAPEHWNQSSMWRLEEPLSPSRMAAVTRQLLIHHDVLRARFRRGEDGVEALLADPETADQAYLYVDLSSLAGEHRRLWLSALADEVQASLDLERGPLVRVVQAHLGDGEEDRLLIVLHHLVVDGVSWRILFEDLNTACAQAAAGEEVVLPPKTTSWRAWAARLVEHARSPELAAELDFWRPPAAVPRLPVDASELGDDPSPEAVAAVNTVASARTVESVLDAETTEALLREVPAAYGARVDEALLTALARAFARLTGRSALLVEMEGHGREDLFDDVDLSRTVGWFTTHYPVWLELGEGMSSPPNPLSMAGEGEQDFLRPPSPAVTLKAIKERLRRVPRNGVGFGLLGYLSDDPAIAAELEAVARPELKVNYLGRFTGVSSDGDTGDKPRGRFSDAAEPVGRERCSRGHRPYLINLNAMVIGGELRCHWQFSAAVHRRETVEAMASIVLDELRQLIEHCRADEAGGYTPADFPLASLDQDELDRLSAAVRQGAEEGVKRPLEDLYPLSPLQESLLAHALVSGGSGPGFEQKNLTLRGELDVATFLAAWQLLVDRHPILRTAFLSQGLRAPVQAVFRRLDLPVEQQDWRSVPDSELGERLAAFLRADRDRGFDPATAPLMRLALIRLRDDAWQFVWSYHHLLLDAWCRNRLLQEFFAVFHALSQGAEPPPPIGRPYREFIAWLAGRDPGEARAFWRRALEGARPTPLAIDRAPSRRRERAYREARLRLSAEASTALQSFAKAHRLTLSSVLHGVWALLLSRYSARREVIFGTTVSGRPAELPGVEDILGSFINNLPVRAAAPPGMTVAAWLTALQGRLSELRELDWVSPGMIQEQAGLPAGQRLYETLVIFQNYPVDEGNAGAAPTEGEAAGQSDASQDVEVLSVTSRLETGFPLTVVAGPFNPLLLRLFYDAARFDEAVIERLAGHLETVLGELIVDGERRLADVPWLSEAERERLAAELTVPLPEVLINLPDRLEALAEAHADEPIVIDAAGQLSRGELEHLAGRLAARLVAQGLERGSTAMLCLEPSRQAVVALLAVLRAGASCLVVDPGASRPSLATLAAASAVSLILTADGLVEHLPEAEIPWLLLDVDELLTVDGDAETLSWTASPADVALIVPSASPSRDDAGILLPHLALAQAGHALDGWWRNVETEETLTLGAVGSLDRVAPELLAALTAGGRVVLAGTADTSELATRLTSGAVNVLRASPAAWRQLLAADWPEGGTIHALIDGDGFARGLADQLAARCASLSSVYGVWEAGGWTASASLIQDEVGSEPLRVVRPLKGVAVRLLADGFVGIPAGLPGRLALGGAGLAYGYAGRPSLTAAHFLPDAEAASPGGRLFRGAELGRRLDGGRGVELLGRLTDDAGLAGPERELAEVEALLCRHPGLLEAAVAPWEDGSGDVLTVAYVVFVPTRATTFDELNDFLQESLPRQRLPALFVRLPELPRDGGGRVLRSALPMPETAWRSTGAPFVAPCDALQLELRQIWERLFGIRPIGIRDDFFALGGHSIVAVRLMSEIRDAFGRDLPLATLLEATTIEKLSQVLRDHLEARPWTPLVEIQRPPVSVDGERPPLFCVHAIGGEVLCYVDLAHYLGPDQPVYGLQSRAWGADESDEAWSIETMAETYLAAIREVRPHGPYHLLGWSFGGMVAFEMVRQLEAAGEEVGTVAILDTLALASQKGNDADLADWLVFFAGRHPALSAEKLRAMPDPEEQLAYFARVVDEAKILPGLDLSMVRRYVLAGLANGQAKDAYEPRPFGGRVTLFRADQGHILEYQEPTLGWQDLARGGVDIEEVPGSHQRLVQRPHVQVLARRLRARLDLAHEQASLRAEKMR